MWRMLIAVWLVVWLPEGAMVAAEPVTTTAPEILSPADLKIAAKSARWEKDEVLVWDFTPEEWRPYVQGTVDDFNASLPPEAPRLVYAPMGEMACERLPKYGRKGGISVCSTERVGGQAFRIIIDGRLTQVKVVLRPLDKDNRPGVLTCHEFTHAVFDSPDQLGFPHADESCVQGRLDHLGPWDIAYAESVYSRNGHHRNKRHRH